MQDAAMSPVRFDIRQPESLSRLLNFPLFIGTTIKAFLLIPHFIIIYLLSIILVVLWILGPFGILFTGNYPQGLFNFNVGINRWVARAYAYYYSTTDDYPAFSLDEKPDDDARLQVDYPESLSRLLNFPIIGTAIKAALVIPQLLVLVIAAIGVLVLIFLGQFVILFSGQMPPAFHGFIEGFLRLSYQVTAWIFSLTDEYPPFIPEVRSQAPPQTPMAPEPPGPPPTSPAPPAEPPSSEPPGSGPPPLSAQ
jgi:Domain of unknown function (DUF4389)